MLPRRLRGGHDFFDTEHSGLPAKLGAEYGIAVANEVSRNLVQSTGLRQLPRRPRGCRVLCVVEMPHSSPVLAQDDQHKQDSEGGCRDSKEIKRNEVSGMIIEKRPPGLRRRPERLIMYLETVASETLIPSFNSSPWTRGAGRRC
jgi:hypothetical protein